MLAQVLIEIARLEEWLTSKTPDIHKGDDNLIAWLSFAPVLYSANMAQRSYIDHRITHTKAGESYPNQHCLDHLADTVLHSLIAIQHLTGDETATGTVLLDRLRVFTRRMVNDQVVTRRNAVRESADALEAQRQFNESLNT